MNMPGVQLKTVVKCYKLRINTKFKCLEVETNNVIAKLQSCVSEFKSRLTELVDRTDENFFSIYNDLDADFEKYQEKLYYLLASIDSPTDSVEFNHKNSNQYLNQEIPDHGSNCSIDPLDHSDSISCNSALDQSFTQTEPKTLLRSQTSLSSYRSLQDCCDTSAEQAAIHKEQNVDFVHRQCPENVQNFKTSSSSIPKTKNSVSKENQQLFDLEKNSKSVSQSSCYRSLSSNASVVKSSTSSNLEETYPFQSVVNDKCEQNYASNQSIPPQLRPNLLIFPPKISVNTVVSATLSHIVNPEDFWMQLKNSGLELNYYSSQYSGGSSLPSIQQGAYYLAPFKSSPYYYRARALNSAEGEDDVEVFFIDHGSSQILSLHDLRPLPSASYKIPMQAFHCSLYEISSVNGVWSKEAIAKFKEFQNNPIQTHVKSLNGDKYGVQLIATISAGFCDEDFSFDIAQTLCLDGLATINQVADSNETCYTSEISNQISCDSGVSVTFNQRASPSMSKPAPSLPRLAISDTDEVLNDLLHESEKVSELSLESGSDNYLNLSIPDLISFSSIEEMNDESNEAQNVPENEDNKASNVPEDEDAILRKKCLKTPQCTCGLHITIPPPSVSFVEKNMMLVMLSNIVDPSEFYVNLAMENSFTLDELREQMTLFYESETDLNSVISDGVKEGMYCACRYDADGSWYRVKVLKVHWKPKSDCDIYVQYLDYGNKTLVECDSLRPLSPKFAKHPSFAIRCSLAGIQPKDTEANSDHEHHNLTQWSNEAIEKFHQLTNYDRCLTAQICESRTVVSTPMRYSESRPLQVLLWDTEGTNDLLINEALVESGVAEIDNTFLARVQQEKLLASGEKDILNNWDPMNEEFHGIQNSYGVHIEDAEVAISGYKPKDESYICRYFSTRGSCPRGDRCEYEHVELAAGGVTRDQEETYSLDPLPSLPNPPTCVLIQVSAVISPGTFYCVMPYGSRSVDEIDSLVLRGTSREVLMKHGNEIKALFAAMNKHYSDAPFMENTAISLAYGTIVAAYRKADNAWHRGRVIDISDITGPSKVFFVDFGNEEWVPRKLIREILPEFLHTPFQAIECHLSDVEPLGYEKGKKWSNQAVHRFKELVVFEILLAKITFRCGKILHLTLKKTKKDNHENIGEILVKEGFAQSCSLITSTLKESKYVPG